MNTDEIGKMLEHIRRNIKNIQSMKRISNALSAAEYSIIQKELLLRYYIA